MAQYSDQLTLRDARQQYFDRNDFGDGGYEDTWVKLKAGPIPIYFPNTKARVRAVKFHDLHHVLAGYETTWSGEAEIAAWEIASGCGRHYAAWILNLNAFAVGLVIAPRAVYKAFLRGRRSSNLYSGVFDDSLLGRTVGVVRHELELDQDRSSLSLQDKMMFIAWASVSVVALVTPYALALTAGIGMFVWLLH